ncbi:heavy-metal-associated domain-containing protein [Enterococcus faecalis]|uniref:Heavy-metal-associated domain-containing protein n=1 Tax=Enterococcus faecalis TaxID=1351 RepID=A0A974NZF7_ENTFL|nr:heavy-metal-associated domain-containing protein [Enterococcus faecalis]
MKKWKVKTFDIEGMSCASCAQTIEKGYGEVTWDGKGKCQFSYGKKLSVTYDQTEVTEEEIKEAVSDAGLQGD